MDNCHLMHTFSPTNLIHHVRFHHEWQRYGNSFLHIHATCCKGQERVRCFLPSVFTF